MCLMLRTRVGVTFDADWPPVRRPGATAISSNYAGCGSPRLGLERVRLTLRLQLVRPCSVCRWCCSAESARTVPHCHLSFEEPAPDGVSVDTKPVADPRQGLPDGVEPYGFVDLPGVENRGAEVDGCPKLRGDRLRAGEVRSSGEHGIRRLGTLPREPPHGQVMA